MKELTGLTELAEVNSAKRNNSADRIALLKKSAERIVYTLYNFADIEQIQQRELEWVQNCLLVAEELLWRVRNKPAFGEILYREKGRGFRQNSRLPH